MYNRDSNCDIDIFDLGSMGNSFFIVKFFECVFNVKVF